jgi:hypothetical protein
MTHDNTGHSHSPAPNPFTPAETAIFHADDRVAARNIVLLMLSIFVIGVALYGVVDYVVGHSPSGQMVAPH